MLRCEFRRAGIQQQSTGLLHLHGFEPVAYTKIKRSPQAPFLLNVEMEKRPQPHQRKESTSYQDDVLSFMKEFG